MEYDRKGVFFLYFLGKLARTFCMQRQAPIDVVGHPDDDFGDMFFSDKFWDDTGEFFGGVCFERKGKAPNRVGKSRFSSSVVYGEYVRQ